MGGLRVAHLMRSLIGARISQCNLKAQLSIQVLGNVCACGCVCIAAFISFRRMSQHSHNEMTPDANQSAYLAVHLSHSGLLSSHVYFGWFCFVLGTWWLIATLRSQFKASPPSQAVLSTSGTCGFCSGKLLEGIIKLVACVFGLVIEQITVSRMGRPENYTYTTIYSSFLLASAVDILIGMRVVLPEGIDFVAHAVAFANLAIVTRAQATGHLHLTVATRFLTSYIATFATIFLTLEIYKPRYLITTLLRTGAVIFQGVWFWQSGLVLDSKFAERWKESDHANLMFITIAFAIDACGVIVFEVMVAVAMAKFFSAHMPGRLRRNVDNQGTGLRVNASAVDDYKPLMTTEITELNGGEGTR